ncbi:extensin family protein [Mesorhizobium sp. Root157]|uniref:extensin-like domain-containing protein n=1 Tax=Mesorhizobium sp. Root157 TaxID=1736477 RepID=UPI0006FDD8DC|nr:extensin family protein [Mesorhizobium sp. Root157]KQZ87130.1 extensin family protein [Mesorhizobium sp. Root157]
MAFSRVRLLPILLFAPLLPLPDMTAAMAGPVVLPHSAPIPETGNRPDGNAGEKPQPEPQTPPLPQPRPNGEESSQPAPPVDAPHPLAKPPAGATRQDEPKPARPLADPRSTVIAAEKMPEEELECRKRLNALGVRFEDRKAEQNAVAGCSLPYPLAIKSLGTSIDLAPEALMSCPMAEAAARFTKAVISPAARAQLGSPLKSIAQASAYVCRPRHNGRKMSEHAFGNALDIASFTLANGTVVEVGAALPQKQAEFLVAVRKAACGPFKTVLGPGSDADHARHLHFDLETRRNGGTFCQ